MPNRYIREGILSSEKVCSLSWIEEVFYRRLMSIVDDYGRYEANPAVLRARLYPLQVDKVCTADIEKWMLATAEAGLCRLYSAENKEYLQLENFGQITRSKSKCPAPDDNNCKQVLAEVSKCLTISRTNSRSRSKASEEALTQNRFVEYPENWEQVQKAAEDIGYAMTRAEAENFLAKWQSKGWKDGKTPILDWRKLLITWKNNAGKFRDDKPDESKFASHAEQYPARCQKTKKRAIAREDAITPDEGAEQVREVLK